MPELPLAQSAPECSIITSAEEGDNVFTFVSLSFCLFVCLPVKTTQKVVDRFSLNFMGRWIWATTNRLDRDLSLDTRSFFLLFHH